MKGRSRLTRHEAAVVSRRLVGPLVDSVFSSAGGYEPSLANSIRAPLGTKFEGDDCDGHYFWWRSKLTPSLESIFFNDLIDGFSAPKRSCSHESTAHASTKHRQAMHVIVSLNTIPRYMNPVWAGDPGAPLYLPTSPHGSMAASRPPTRQQSTPVPRRPTGRSTYGIQQQQGFLVAGGLNIPSKSGT